MDRSYIALNDAERERLEVIVARHSDRELGRSLKDGWTIGAALAHLAFWDRYLLVALEKWERDAVLVPPLDVEVIHIINDAMLAQWRALSPTDSASEAISSAEAVDKKIENLDAELVEMVLASGRLAIVDRSIHRRKHLDEIESSLTDLGGR